MKGGVSTMDDWQPALELYSRALAAKLDGITDPWEILSMYQFNGGEMTKGYMTVYAKFMHLVARRPRSEQDMLLYAGKKVFHVRITSMRKDLAWSRLLDALISDDIPRDAA